MEPCLTEICSTFSQNHWKRPANFRPTDGSRWFAIYDMRTATGESQMLYRAEIVLDTRDVPFALVFPAGLGQTQHRPASTCLYLSETACRFRLASGSFLSDVIPPTLWVGFPAEGRDWSLVEWRVVCVGIKSAPSRPCTCPFLLRAPPGSVVL